MCNEGPSEMRTGMRHKCVYLYDAHALVYLSGCTPRMADNKDDLPFYLSTYLEFTPQKPKSSVFVYLN